jgi:Domain of unknown function (DUF4282)
VDDAARVSSRNKGERMQAKGFFRSLFDFSFSSFVTPKLIKLLYVLMTIAVALWTLTFILYAFRSSTAVGVLALIIGGPIFFVISMIYVRVGLELLIVLFRIHGDVAEINLRGGGSRGTNGDGGGASMPMPATVAAPAPVGVAAEPAAAPAPAPEPAPSPATEESRFCEGCGAERTPGKKFCLSCGAAF